MYNCNYHHCCCHHYSLFISFKLEAVGLPTDEATQLFKSFAKRLVLGDCWPVARISGACPACPAA